MQTLWLFSYMTGVWAATCQNDLSVPLVLLLTGASALIWWLLQPRKTPLSSIGFFLLLGLSLATLSLNPRPGQTDIRSLTSEKEVLLLGQIERIAAYDPDSIQLDLSRMQVWQQQQQLPLHGNLRLKIKQHVQDFRPGDWIQFRSKLKRPRMFGIPGEFNRPLYLASLGIHATAYQRDDRGIVLRSVPGPLSLQNQLLRHRGDLIRQLNEQQPGRSGRLLQALLLGDKSSLNQPLRDSLARAGIAHLFSVSGLHLGLVAGLLYFTGFWFYRRSTSLLNWQPACRILPMLTLPILWGYTILTGMAVPTQRALLMVACCALLLLFRRQSSPLDLLKTAAFGLLIIEPLALFSPAFQLSIAGLWGITTLLPRWAQKITTVHVLLRKPAQIFLATLAATCTTLPLTLLYFHQGSVVGPLVNLIAVPLTGLLALPIGLGGLLLLTVGIPAGDLLLRFSGQVVELCLRFAEWMLNLPLFPATDRYLDPLQFLSIVALLAGIMISSHNIRQRKQLRYLCFTTAALLMFLPNQTDHELKLTSLSVGQGESTLVTLNRSHHYLVDGGGFRNSSFDVGQRLLAPALGRLGVHALDAIILTHNHPDHSRGLEYILKQYSDTPLISAVPAEQLDYHLPATAQNRIVHPRPGWQELQDNPDLGLSLMRPDQRASNLNDRSLVLYARNGDDGVLLTGDLDQAGVHQLLNQPPPGPTTLLKLPHHGSRHSNTELLLTQLQPLLSFVSAGHNNHFGLPHPQLLKQLASLSIPVYRTDLDGSLQFRTSGHGWEVKADKDWLFR